jgi:exopolysaccharide production protein ExoY
MPTPVWLRAIDCLLAGLGLLAISPALAVIGLIIRLLSHRSPLVAHLRIGRGGRPFWMIKFRTMWSDAEPAEYEKGWVQRVVSREVQEVKPRVDPRVTSRFAAFCRAYSLDEFPQLWHALVGEMSLVGPRPLTAIELERYYGECASYILTIPPGMTGLWQVRGRNNLTYRKRLRLDMLLVEKYSLGLYLWILMMTIPRVVSADDAW